MIKKMIIAMMMATIILPGASGSTMKIYPSDDAFVRSRHSSTNYGERADLRAGYNTNYGTDRSYLKFDLSSLQGDTINSAVFSIDTVFYQNNPTINLYSVSNNNWDESTITWSNKPSYDSLIDSETISSPDRIEFDVTSGIEGNEFSFVMIEQGENTDAQFYSKDLNTGMEGDEVFWPYLEVEYGEGGGCATDADADGNGMISMVELLDYISEWKAGNVNMLGLLDAIGLWKAGEGC